MSKIAQSISITIIIINTTEMQSLTSVFLYLHHPKRQSEMKCIGRTTNPIRLLGLSAFIRDVLFGHRQLTTRIDPIYLTDWLTELSSLGVQADWEDVENVC